MKKSVLSVLALTALSSLGLAACGNQASGSHNGVVNMSEPSNLLTLDQSKLVDQVSDVTLNNSNQGLLVMTKNSQVVPGVAKNYKVSKDGKTYTFNLRHSKWSNGTPVTAKDFVYGFQRSVNPKTAAAYQYLFDNVHNAGAVAKGKMPVSSLGVKAEGDYKFVVSLDKPETYFKYVATMPPTYPQSKSEVDKYGSGYATTSDKQLYNGAFQVKGWTGTNDNWQLVKNPYYWDKNNTKLSTMKFSVAKDPQTALDQYQSGNLDEMQLSGKSQVSSFKGNSEYHPRKEAGTYYLEMNQKKVAALRNVNVRKALSLAVNRNELTNNVLGNGSVPAKGFVASDMSKYKGKDFTDDGYVSSAVSSNLEQAKKLFVKGMKEVGQNKLNLSLLSDDSSDSKSMTEFMQNEFQKLPGLTVNDVNVPAKVATSRTEKGDFDLTVDAWIADFPDPVSFMSLMTTNNGYNHGGWSNSQYDSLMKKATTNDANNYAKRWNDMVNAQKVMLKDQAVAPLYQLVSPQVLKNRVQGVNYYPSGGNYDFRYVHTNN
ncbi:peptide ABC transporter substrate-binding protein [Apilactobacillus micheneri]|uniref:Peptide ABC transporter substrate-binding protein n=1 Tax=Apilactobacillus micheneri TaxID=1899430 RepID=A0A9Q8INH3_9LACO|nr:peptide ABC transporter substrate-binding protein [Apilactobacillus micheneri]TPR39971.1 peptide ABC transporter substrate-binding protein [Apilactobacillus micheneri]TPR41784.1 peptide ABC transporter substrate-binding protein [Apilactobacillus micheneri]TPR44173.1 peptide ABC transporter substrate-binding protein [Apilactobacillus micheneri]TPR45797.1 peptide ABC transporter substrate-binding protein [Apilactobacillus micheneri]TPR50541.1 peptide ABC transporter substrate-binding protein 